MRPALLRLAALAAALLAACAAPSIHPLATDANTVRDDRLLGTWKIEDDEKSTYTVAAEGQGYVVTCVELEGERLEYRVSAALVAVGNHRVLDVRLHEEQLKALPVPPALVLPVHYFLALEFPAADRARLRLVHPDFVEAWFAEPRDVAHVRVEDVVVLAAEPAGLEALLARWLAADGGFSIDVDLRRVPE